MTVASLGLFLLLPLAAEPPAAASAGPAPSATGAPAPSPSDQAPPSPAPDGAKPPSFYETTTVTARPVSTATTSVTVVEDADLAAAAARSGTDVLRETPGLNLLPTGSRAGVTNAWVRGADPNFTLVLLDGIPLNDSTDLQGGAVNLEELPAGLVGRAELVRGPLTSFYGPSSLSGVVQLFTPRGGPGPLRLSLGAEAGNADLRRAFARACGERGDAAAGRPAWPTTRRGTASRTTASSSSTATRRPTSRSARRPTSRLTARLATGEQDDYPDSSGGPVYGTGETRHTEHDDLALGARLLVGAPAGRAAAGHRRPLPPRPGPGEPGRLPARPGVDREHALHPPAPRPGRSPSCARPRTSVDAGLSGEGEWGENRSLLKLPPDLGGDVAGDYDEAAQTGGVFGALRHERGAVLFEVALRADAATGDSLQLHPHAGVVYRPGGGRTRLHASAGRASKLPSFFALSSPPALGGNPDLKPERTVGGEAGVEQALLGGAARRSGRRPSSTSTATSSTSTSTSSPT